MIGFAYNSEHEFCAVLIQPYIIAKREATETEITECMKALGFEMDYIDEFIMKITKCLMLFLTTYYMELMVTYTLLMRK